MIIPAIDLINGGTVRLYQGDYDQKTEYSQTPEQLIDLYNSQGAEILHLVDLDGAKASENRQSKRLAELMSLAPFPVQAGGGVRCKADVEQLLALGASRVVIGSMAIKSPAEVKSWFETFGADKLVLALDVNIQADGRKSLPTHGWIESSDQTLESLLAFYGKGTVKHVLCTDISRDGTLSGSNVELYQELVEQFPDICWQASGGIGSLADITAVARTGVDGIILGRALLDGNFTLAEAIACWQNG